MKKRYFIFIIFLSCLFSSCEKFEYSPYQDDIAGETPHDLNNRNIEKLLSNTADDDTVTIIYSGDSQRYYDRLDDLVAKVNTYPDVDFFVLCGDIADFGVLQEYIWIYDRLKKLDKPYICVIGNHDMSADNGHIFTKVFGEKNFSFTYKRHKFLFHDTNGREYNFDGKVPDIGWLQTQLNDPVPDWFVGLSHVPPYDVDFDPAVEMPYAHLWASNPKFILSLHGHLHTASESYFYNDGVHYMTCNSVKKSEVTMLKFINGQVITTVIPF